MAAIMNGVALHGGFIPYGGTFLTFSDYSRNAIRMAALMKPRVIHVFTHDSIGLGEDGPTHQPVEHVPSLRLIPNLDVWRPGDALETAVAWASALARRDGPTALVLSRQNLPRAGGRRRHGASACGARRLRAVGAGRVARAVHHRHRLRSALALAAQAQLAQPRAWPSRVVSMPCTNGSTGRTRPTSAACCPRTLPAVAVEAGAPDFWRKYVGRTARGRHRRVSASRPRRRRCTRSSASRRTRWWRPCATCWGTPR